MAMRSDLWLPEMEAGGWGIGGSGQSVQMSSYKLITCNVVYNMMTKLTLLYDV